MPWEKHGFPEIILIERSVFSLLVERYNRYDLVIYSDGAG
jgi:hypothetical protein